MAMLKCKMCGGDLTVNSDSPIVECEYCGSKQTIPSADNERKVSLFDRAERLRRKCEYSKAESVYRYYRTVSWRDLERGSDADRDQIR